MDKKVYFQNREISWLRFNERVLFEACEEEVPLLEKLKFISIFVSNLDEFFMVRVGSLHDLTNLKKNVVDNKTLMTAQEQIDKILEMLPEMYREKDSIFKDVTAKLWAKNIRHLKYKDLSDEQKAFVNEFYSRHINTLLSPQIVDLNHPFPFIENNKLYIIAELVKDKEKVFGLFPVRKSYPEYLILPGENVDYILMEDILLNLVEKIFKDYKVLNKSVFKVTRNFDFKDDRDTQEEFEDYQEYMKTILKKRKRLEAVRLVCQEGISEASFNFILDQINLEKKAAFTITSPLNMHYVFGMIDEVPMAIKKDLLYPPLNAYKPTENDKSVIEKVRKKDILLSYPYEKMDSFIDLLKEASTDPECKSIKITIYRLAKNSRIVRYLCEASQNGKEVTVFVELKARFDEESNIHYANILYEEGCNIIYGFSKYKMHSKICLITFRNSFGDLSYITQIGTGNYNESTAKQYTDFSLITANEDIALDATDFFKNMSLGNLNGKYKYLLQSPTSLKTGLMKLVQQEIDKGEDGFILCKVNSLTDKDFIDKFVEASQKGVRVILIIRGISCLLPGIEGYSDNIKIISIVGRFLEHPRVYIFDKGHLNIYISSADLMTRNTENRVEIATPILDPDIREKICHYVSIQLKDTVGARLMQENGKYRKMTVEEIDGIDKRISAQKYFIREAEEKIKEDTIKEKEKEEKDNISREIRVEEEKKQGFFQRLLDFFRGK